MNKTLLSLALCLLLSLSALTPVLADSTAVHISLSDRGLAFSLMQQTASSYFQIKIGDHPYLKQAPVKAFPLFYLSTATKKPPEVIWKQKGKGWGKLAKELGLPANFHGKYMSAKNKHKKGSPAKNDDELFEELLIIRFLHEYYGADPDILFYWRSRGLSYDDLFIGVNLGLRLKKSPTEFFSLRVAGKDWRFIATQVKVPYSTLSQPVKKQGKFFPLTQDEPPAKNNKGKKGKGKNK